MANFVDIKVPVNERQFCRNPTSKDRTRCIRQKTMDEAFLTRTDRSREGSTITFPVPATPPDEDLDLQESSQCKLDVDEIKKRLYQRECSRLGVTPVGAIMRAPSPVHLSIPHYSLGPLGARALAVPLMLDSTLTSLDLEGNGIGAEGLASLMEMLVDHTSLTHLGLKRNQLGGRGATLICQLLQTNTLLTSINAAANEFEDKDSLAFADMLKVNKTLKTLDLSDNRLGHLAGKVLGDALGHNETLEALDLSWNQFREGGAAKLLDGLKVNMHLKSLNLAFNAFNRGLCERPSDPLGSALASNSTLKFLDVSNNRLSDLDLFGVAKGLKVNEALESLKIVHNLSTVRGTGGLLKAVLGNAASGMQLLDMTNLPVSIDDLDDVSALEARGVKVIQGPVHQRETDFDSEPRPSRHKDKEQAEKERKDQEIMDAKAKDRMNGWTEEMLDNGDKTRNQEISGEKEQIDNVVISEADNMGGVED